LCGKTGHGRSLGCPPRPRNSSYFPGRPAPLLHESVNPSDPLQTFPKFEMALGAGNKRPNDLRVDVAPWEGAVRLLVLFAVHYPIELLVLVVCPAPVLPVIAWQALGG